MICGALTNQEDLKVFFIQSPFLVPQCTIIMAVRFPSIVRDTLNVDIYNLAPSLSKKSGLVTLVIPSLVNSINNRHHKASAWQTLKCGCHTISGSPQSGPP